LPKPTPLSPTPLLQPLLCGCHPCLSAAIATAITTSVAVICALAFALASAHPAAVAAAVTPLSMMLFDHTHNIFELNFI
jgi:hypothetical protein